MPIINQDRFPGVEWLKPEDFKVVGTIGGTPLVLLGHEPGFEDGKKNPILARSYSQDPATEDLSPIPLENLMLSQDPINITQELG